MRWRIWLWLLGNILAIQCSPFNPPSEDDDFLDKPTASSLLDPSSHSTNPASILIAFNRPPVPDSMPKCPAGTFLACCIMGFVHRLVGCSWWDLGAPCDKPYIKLVCCADFHDDDVRGYEGICDGSEPTLQPATGFSRFVPETIYKILPEVVPEFVIP